MQPTEFAIRTRRTTKNYKGLNPGRLIQLRNNDFEEFNEKYTDNLEYKTSIYSVLERTTPL